MNTKGVTDFRAMTGPELVVAYNEMIDTALDLGITWHVPTKRFSGVAAGLRRCETLHREIQEEAAKRRSGGGEAVKVATDPVKHTPAVGKGVAAGLTTKVPPVVPGGALTLDTQVAVLVKENPRTTPKTRARFAFWKDGVTIRAYAEAFPHPSGKRESERRAIRDFKRARREGWLGVLPADFAHSKSWED